MDVHIQDHSMNTFFFTGLSTDYSQCFLQTPVTIRNTAVRLP